jgi:protocatechuate 3,4-dioxygenase beta subunit
VKPATPTARKRWVLVAIVAAVLAGFGYLTLGPILGPSRESGTTRDEDARSAPKAPGERALTPDAAPTAAERQSVAKENAVAWKLRVLDESTRDPVSGARVRLSARDRQVDGVSAGDGSVVLELEGASQRSTADALVEHPSYFAVRVAALTPTEAHDVTMKRGGEIAGRCVPSPNAPAALSLYEQTSEDEKAWPVRRVESDAHGNFHFAQLEPGDYTLSAAFDGWTTPTLHSLRIESGKVRELTLNLTPASVLRGRLLSPGDELPIEGARVTISLEDARRASREPAKDREVTTGAGGRFEFRDLAATTYALVFRSRECGGFRRLLTVVHGGEPIDQDFYAPPKVIVHGRAVDARKMPLEDATFALLDEFSSANISSDVRHLSLDGIPSTHSAADGRFSITSRLDKGGNQFLLMRSAEAAAAGMSWLWFSLYGSGDKTDIDVGDVRLPRPRIINGVVRHASGAVVPSATVEVMEFNKRTSSSTKSNDDGSFSIGAPDDGGQRTFGLTLSARIPGFSSDRVKVDKPAADPIDLVLHPVRLITGRVIDTDGRAVPSIQIVLGTPLPDHKRGPKLGGGDIPQITDEFGRFRFEDVVSMESEIALDGKVQDDWLIETRDPATIPADGDQEVKIVARRVESKERASVRGRLVVAKELADVRELRIEALPLSETANEPDPNAYPWRSKKRGIVERDGDAFVLGNVSPGRIMLQISCSDCVPVARPLEVRPGETFDVGDIALRRAVSVSVHLVDASGKPVSDAEVEFLSGDGERATPRVINFKNGTYYGRPPCGGSIDVRIRRAGRADRTQKLDVPCEAPVDAEMHVD